MNPRETRMGYIVHATDVYGKKYISNRNTCLQLCVKCIDIILKNRLINAYTTSLVCLVSTVICYHKNVLLRPSNSRGHITKLEQFTFL